MAKLHQVLAVESNLKTQAQVVLNDLAKTFTTKVHHFGKKITTFQPNDENAKPVTEQVLDMQTSVRKELDWVRTHVEKAIDVGYQVDVGNTMARADVLDEDGKTVLIAGVPATALLQLEKRMAEFRTLIVSIPTLDPAKGFQPDQQEGNGIYKARQVVKPRTKKDKKVLEKAKATDKFPAQVEVYDADVITGMIHEDEWSSLITPAEKAALLERTDKLIRALKRARATANDTEVDVTTHKVGGKLMDYVLGATK